MTLAGLVPAGVRLTAPATISVPHRSDDLRLGALLGRSVRQARDARAVILGFPTDVGVARNGGRTGARLGPQAIRDGLARLTPPPHGHERFVSLAERTVDLGDLECSADLEADQAGLAAVLAPVLAEGLFAMVLGGGHETAYGHFLGYVAAGRNVSIVNLDSHPDVRPLIDGLGHSGSPFRQAMDHASRRLAAYTVLGLDGASCSATHLHVVEAAGGSAWFRDQTTPERYDAALAIAARPALASFDLDAVDAAHAPGVSASATGGLDAVAWRLMANLAGRSPNVQSMEVVELAPPYDVDGRTARLAALTVWEFLRGLSTRS